MTGQEPSIWGWHYTRLRWVCTAEKAVVEKGLGNVQDKWEKEVNILKHLWKLKLAFIMDGTCIDQ